MLVLSRKCEESIIINNDLEIKIIEISGETVRLGIEAPQSYRVLRKELVLTIEDNKQATKPIEKGKLVGLLSGVQKHNLSTKKSTDKAADIEKNQKTEKIGTE